MQNSSGTYYRYTEKLEEFLLHITWHSITLNDYKYVHCSVIKEVKTHEKHQYHVAKVASVFFKTVPLDMVSLIWLKMSLLTAAVWILFLNTRMSVTTVFFTQPAYEPTSEQDPPIEKGRGK